MFTYARAMGYVRELPPEAALRDALYAGTLFHTAPSAASTALADDVAAVMREHLPGGDPRFAQAELAAEDFFARIGAIRKRLFVDPHFQARVRDVIAACGFDPARVAFDPVRLRVVSSDGHREPRAAGIYHAHRDTWFGLSQAVIAGWIALHDIPEEQTFLVYPDWLERPVANSSAGFDYDAWKADARELKIGWQDRDAGKQVHYCGTVEDFAPGTVVPLAARRADTVLFSGAHLHQTRAHSAGHTRFSLDFRFVHLDDVARGPKNVDNRARGDATADYVRA